MITPLTLDRRKKYLQVALNSTLSEAAEIIRTLPESDRILLEAGTPLIKHYGIDAIRFLKNSRPQSAGASGAIALGQAPVETINIFIQACHEFGLDSMLDMMNVEHPIKILRKLKKQPDVVVLHRGVDEETYNRDKPIPYIQINKVRASYDVLIAIAGGDTIREVQRAVFNDANIVIVWKEFYQPTSETGKIAEEFLKQIK